MYIKKLEDSGFEPLDSNSDPNLIGAALSKHWQLKVENDATDQNVTDKRILVLLKTEDKKHYAVFEEDIVQYAPEVLLGVDECKQKRFKRIQTYR